MKFIHEAEGGEEMKELTSDEILDIMCAPVVTDEPDESDFIAGDEIGEEEFIGKFITKELN